MSLTARVTSITNQVIMPKLVDTVLKSNVLLSRLLPKAKTWQGTILQLPVKVTNTPTGSSFSGFDTFSISSGQPFQKLQFNDKAYQKTITLPLTEANINSGDAGVINLLDAYSTVAEQEMADEIGTIFYGTGAGNGGRDFLGMEAIVDNGTNAATYGGLSRTTYPTLNSSVTTAVGTLTLNTMVAAYNAVSDGSIQPTAIYCSPTTLGYIEQIYQPYNRVFSTNPANKPLEMNQGISAFQFKGMPVFPDRKATSGTIYMVNEDYLYFYAVPSAMDKGIQYDMKIDGNNYNNLKGFGFQWTGWKPVINGYSLVGQVILQGELASQNPGRHAKLTGITGA